MLVSPEFERRIKKPSQYILALLHFDSTAQNVPPDAAARDGRERRMRAWTFTALSALAALAMEDQGQAMGTEARAAASQVDPEGVLREVRRIIGENYVLPERRPGLDMVLAEGLRSGRYRLRDPLALAERINQDLERVGKDRHLYFSYDPRRYAAMTARTTENRPDPTLLEREVRSRNHGISELRVLPGNVRYLDLASFDWIGDESRSAVDLAMEFLGGGDAVIIDLRNNGGGHPESVHRIISHFMEADRPLITFQQGDEISPMMSTVRDLKAARMIGKPLYVLTSGITGSAAEEFVGHVAGYQLGEVVGATTSGGAYMNNLYPITGGFILSVSVGRPVLAATGKDWEAVGIAPTIASAPDSALQKAHAHALRGLAAKADPARAAELEAAAAGLDAVAESRLPAASLTAYAGTYQDREIVLADGRLWYRQAGRPRRPLVALGGHVFTFGDDPLMRLTFHPTGEGITAFSIGPATMPAMGPYERNG
jgi:hypothetical protein